MPPQPNPRLFGPRSLPYERFDRIADETRDGNLLLQFTGYARPTRSFENTLNFFYYRLSYALYPRRVYVAPANNVINNSRDIIRDGFNPDRQWLREHDVRFALTSWQRPARHGHAPRLPAGG